MSTRVSQESHILRAQKIHGEILKIYEETVESIYKLKSESAADRLHLLRGANFFADDLNNVVCNLSQVAFKIDKSNHAHGELLDIVNILCGMATGIHRFFQHDHENFKAELKNTIKVAAQVAERLLTIIRSDDFHELKLELLNSQADVLFAVDRVRLTNQLKYQNPQQLADFVHHKMEDIKAVMSSLDSKDPNIKQKLVQSTNHGLLKYQKLIDHIQTAVISDHFNDEIKNLFLDIVNEANKYVADMNKIFLKDSHIDELIEDCHKIVNQIITAITKLIPLLATKDNEKVSDSGMELVGYIYAYGISSICQIVRGMQHLKNDS